MRNLFTTKTALAQYILASAGILSAFFPNAVPFVTQHAGEIMIIASLLGLAIRKVTHGRVQLWGSASMLLLMVLLPLPLVACSADHRTAVRVLRNPALVIIEQQGTKPNEPEPALVREASEDEEAERILRGQN